MNVAVLDIGSNTTKILIISKDQSGKLKPLAEKSYPCRLGMGLSREQPVLSSAMIDLTLKVIDQLLSFAKPFSPIKIRIVATEAIRRLKNSKSLIVKVQNRFSLNIEILSGEEEASFIADGLLTDPCLSSVQEFCAIDLGGGSMEIMKITAGRCQQVLSLPLGAVVLSEDFFGDLSKKPAEIDIIRLQKYVSSTLEYNCSELLQNCNYIVGAGGSIVFLRHIISELNQIEQTVESILPELAIKQITEKIISLDLGSRIKEFPHLPRDRADVFPAALLVILELLKFCKLTELTHSFHNLRYGVAEEILKSNLISK